ncbi:hypothetical protein Aspvir_009563 [Aspergillus viridinutans]|uniref:Uncharacterized protein n=1 Tax=Aspergillus viridinutans TaxID=75553 RepID=A0A9P3BZQ4_ASPVI|nr:uncharacterized protein Aspvir_009563 [Aspergillus viridinutans]GIK05453.1 hypothetical protein Aspvir_009563 [Aspergillus viridinutans]
MSASIQRIAAAAVHAVGEANLALAHVNFDFSLVKYEVPAELQPIRQSLSKARKQSAEEGSSHILARRLGVLFQDVLPEVPALLEAYGTRVTEIVQETTDTMDQPKGLAETFFGSHLGIDYTTIWASATSGRSVLRMHLLACMLARIWSPQEATAIWAELVSHRQMEIKQQAAMSGDIEGYTLAQAAASHEINRLSLSSWDASARAWLEVADRACVRQQDQIRLIVNNLSVAVKAAGNHNGRTSSSKENSSDSVIQNLSCALTALDKLIRGEPQRIIDGGVLLGLTSWHIYPDLVVLGSVTREIRQKDPLVQDGGIVTISIASRSDSDRSRSPNGVYWSLPLASLRYYGTVQRERSTMHDSRLTVAQLQALVLGASLDSPAHASIAGKIFKLLWAMFYSRYQVQLQESRGDALPLSDKFADAMKESVLGFKQNMKVLQLIYVFMDGIDLLSSEDEIQRKAALQLLKYGANYGKSWIGAEGNSPQSFFGLANLPSILHMVSSPEARVEILRRMCLEHSLDDAHHIIRLRTAEDGWIYVSVKATANRDIPRSGAKRKRSEYEGEAPGIDQQLHVPDGESWICFPPSGDEKSGQHNVALEELYANMEQLGELQPYGQAAEGSPSSQRDLREPLLSDAIFYELLDDNPDFGRYVYFDFVMGVHNLAAVYSRRPEGKMPLQQKTPTTVPLDFLHSLLERNLIRSDVAARYLYDDFDTERTSHGYSLLALGRIVDYYKRHLPRTTVSINVIKKPLNSWKWTASLVSELEFLPIAAYQQARDGHVQDTIYPSPLSREHAFAAILQLESGTVNVDNTDLTRVMAISSGNSLFIAKRLIHDPIPSIEMTSCAVAHVVGNVGKPGISLLTAPLELEIRKHDLERWRFINHYPFDGDQSGGRFEGTSIHLSFTGFEVPVTLESSSYREMEAYYLETKVAMNDGGEWVADLDILRGLADPRLEVRGLEGNNCVHGNPRAAKPNFSITFRGFMDGAIGRCEHRIFQGV